MSSYEDARVEFWSSLIALVLTIIIFGAVAFVVWEWVLPAFAEFAEGLVVKHAELSAQSECVCEGGE